MGTHVKEFVIRKMTTESVVVFHCTRLCFFEKRVYNYCTVSSLHSDTVTRIGHDKEWFPFSEYLMDHSRCYINQTERKKRTQYQLMSKTSCSEERIKGDENLFQQLWPIVYILQNCHKIDNYNTLIIGNEILNCLRERGFYSIIQNVV